MLSRVESDDEIAGLERQMQDLQNRIDQIRADKHAAKLAARKAAQIPRPPKPVQAKKAPGADRPPKATQPRRKSNAGAVNGANGSGSKKHKSQRDSVETEEIVTFEMKRELAVKITNFEGENLERAIDIIRMGRPDLLSVRFYSSGPCNAPSRAMPFFFPFFFFVTHAFPGRPLG